MGFPRGRSRSRRQTRAPMPRLPLRAYQTLQARQDPPWLVFARDAGVEEADRVAEAAEAAEGDAEVEAIRESKRQLREDWCTYIYIYICSSHAKAVTTAPCLTCLFPPIPNRKFVHACITGLREHHERHGERSHIGQEDPLPSLGSLRRSRGAVQGSLHASVNLAVTTALTPHIYR